MARAPKEETREKGLYKNGNRWWIRVKSPVSGLVKPQSTGTAKLEQANKIARMLEELHENRPQWEWLELAARGEVELMRLYNHRAAGTLHELRAELERATQAAEQAAADVDVEPWVKRWAEERVAGLEISERTKGEYVRQVRALIPADVAFPRSKLTDDYVEATLRTLKDERSGEPLSSSTKCRYVAAWRLFFKYARKRVPLLSNPLEDADEEGWLPTNNPPRSVHWDHETTRAVLDRVSGEARVAMTLVFGTGIEVGALLSMTGAHVGKSDNERTIIAPGTKNEYRESRTIFVDRWAWPVVREHARLVLPMAPLFTISEKALREAFYWAQVAAGLIAKPEKSESYKWLWKAVNPHTIHDARHTYAIVRTLGLDGEPRQDAKFIAHQLGHADEQMVTRIYNKTNVRERLKLIELREAREAGERAAKAQEAK